MNNNTNLELEHALQLCDSDYDSITDRSILLAAILSSDTIIKEIKENSKHG